MRLLDRLPPSFPFRGTILGAVPKPVQKVGPLEFDPVSPMNFGFQWGVKPVFDLKSIGPPVEFAVGGAVNARYVLKLIDKPGSLVPQLGLFVPGRFQRHDRLDEPSRTVATADRPQGVVRRRHPGSLLGSADHLLIGVAVVNGAAGVESVGPPALRACLPAALGTRPDAAGCPRSKSDKLPPRNDMAHQSWASMPAAGVLGGTACHRRERDVS